MNQFFTLLCIVCGVYILVLLMILADLWSGIRKAKQRGELRSSTGYKRTVSKIARYYNALVALTITDAMQLGSCWYLNRFCDFSIPLFPLITILGGIGICLIEIRSIYEKNDDKIKAEYTELARTLSTLARERDISEITKILSEYITRKKS